MKKALFAGSFDPFTNGHLDIVRQASEVFDEIIIAVAYNSEKKNFLSLETRIDLIKRSVSCLKNVTVDLYEGLTVDYAKRNNVNILVRGIRNPSDFVYEQQIAGINQSLASEIRTVFFVPNQENSQISSTMVREIYVNKGDISKFVPIVW